MTIKNENGGSAIAIIEALFKIKACGGKVDFSFPELHSARETAVSHMGDVKDFELLQKILGPDFKLNIVKAEDAPNECPGCPGCGADEDDYDTESDVESYLSELVLEALEGGDADLMIRTLATVLMNVAKDCNMQELSRAAHEVWMTA